MVFIYLYLLILPVIVLACLTMRLNSRYGLEGKSAAATTLSVLIGIEYFTILNFLVDRGGNPDGYIIYYTLFATYVIGQTLAILGFNYIPLVSLIGLSSCIQGNLRTRDTLGLIVRPL